MSLALQVLQNRMEKPTWVDRLSRTGYPGEQKLFQNMSCCPTYQKTQKKHKPQQNPPNKKPMGNSNNLENYLHPGTNIYQIKQNSSYFAVTVRHSIMSGNCFPISGIKMFLCPNPFHGFRGTLFDSLWMVHRRNKKILRRFNIKHLRANFRTLRWTKVLVTF